MMDQGRPAARRAQRGPWSTEVVEGDPIQVEGRNLVPVVRVASRIRRRASLYRHGVGGHGYGFVRMRPVAILDQGEGRVRHQIRNETARVIWWLIVVALLMPGFAALLVYLCRGSDNVTSLHSSA